MSKSKTQVSVKVHQDVKEGMDEYADEQNLNRSQTVEEIYHQWGSLTNYGETHPDLITERLTTDPLDERPDSTLAGLLWDARRDIHTFFAVMLLATILSVVSTGVFQLAAGAVALLYLLTVTVGFIDATVLNNSIKLWSMDDSADAADAGVEA